MRRGERHVNGLSMKEVFFLTLAHILSVHRGHGELPRAARRSDVTTELSLKILMAAARTGPSPGLM